MRVALSSFDSSFAAEAAGERRGQGGGERAARSVCIDFTNTMCRKCSGLLFRYGEDVDNFVAVAALPSFDLFPWFFVVPGALVAILAAVAMRSRRPSDDDVAPPPNIPALAGKESS